MRRFYAVYASAEMMKVLPEPGCNDPVRAQSVVRSSQARGGSPAHAGRVRPAACSLCMGLRSAWSLHIQIRPSSASGSGICNRARWRGCVSYFTLATFSGRAAATRPREGPMVRIHLPPAASQQRTARQRSAASSERLLRALRNRSRLAHPLITQRIAQVHRPRSPLSDRRSIEVEWLRQA